MTRVVFLLRERPFLARFLRHYRLWRRLLPRGRALRAAWIMARS